jgi:integrase/recombinase XerD
MITLSDLEAIARKVSSVQGGAGASVDLKTAVDAFLLSAQADGLSDATRRWYRSILNALAEAHQTPVSALTPEDMRRYIVSLRDRRSRYAGAPQRPQKDGGLSDSTIGGHITALHAFWSWCAREYAIENPMRNIKRFRNRIKPPAAIRASDFMKLFETCEEDEAGYRDRALLAMLADSGVRLNGICGLRVTDIDLSLNRAQVTEKGDKARTVVFTKYTRALIALWLDYRRINSDYVFTNLMTGEALTPSGVEQVLRRLKKRSGVAGRVNPHSFRHAFAREYIRAGGDAVTLAKLIGHSDVNTTAAYYAIFTTDELAELHEKRSPLLQLMTRGA